MVHEPGGARGADSRRADDQGAPRDGRRLGRSHGPPPAPAPRLDRAAPGVHPAQGRGGPRARRRVPDPARRADLPNRGRDPVARCMRRAAARARPDHGGGRPMTTGSTMVQLEGAARWFGAGHTRVVALHPTSLSVASGELLAVMGPSGSGKTTLLSLVGGLDKPSEGRVIVDGKDVGAMTSRDLAVLRRRTVGYVFQDLNLLAGLTAAENVAIPLELDGMAIGKARAAAQDALGSVGLAELI